MRPITVSEFLIWTPPGGDGRHWQLVDGHPQPLEIASPTRGAIHAELGALIGNHLLQQSSPFSVIMSIGIVPRVLSATNFRVVDLAVACSGYRIEEFSVPDPIMLVELLTDTNHAETWSNIWTYTTIPSVREIMVVNSITIGAELLRRNRDGSWPEQPDLIENGDLVLDSIGFRVPVTALYRTTHLARGG